MLSAAFIEHQLPHRLRLKIPSKRGDGAFFEELARRSSMLPGVTALSANPVTASILIHHAGDSEAVMAMMVQEGLLDVCPKPELSVRAGARGAPRVPTHIKPWRLVSLASAPFKPFAAS